MNLYEILIPTIMNSKPVRTKHHKNWDLFVQGLAGGLTLLKPISGKWLCPEGQLYEERVIPVRVACTPKQLEQILKFTIRHYVQKVIMTYKLSEEVIFYEEKNES